jgi:parvulin-like peptidyl-prolyl isomerase
MSGRHLREWPRLIAAAVVTAVLLVVIGFAVASTSSSSGGSKTVTAKRAAVVQAKSTTSGAQARQVSQLQSKLRSQSAQLAKARSELVASQARTHCWRGKARHPKKQRGIHCPAGPLTSQ